MMYDVATAQFIGTYAEQILPIDSNGRVTVTVASESLAIVFLSVEPLGNVLQPAIDQAVAASETGDIVGVVGDSGSFIPAFGGGNSKPGNKILGAGGRNVEFGFSLIALAFLLI